MRRRWIFSLLVFLPIFALAQTGNLVPYRLQHTDRIIVDKMDEEYVTTLSGNVHFFYGRIEFRADEAIIYEKQNYARMTGHVSATNDTIYIDTDSAVYYRTTAELYADGHIKATRDTLLFTGDHAIYYRNQDRLLVNSNAVYTESHADSTKRVVLADKVDYHRREEKVTAEGNVRAHDEREKMRGTCGYLEYDLAKGYGYLIREPKAWLEGKDSLFIEADKIEYFRDDNKLVANFDVSTWNKDFHSHSDFLMYFLKAGEAVFLGQPEFHLDQADAWAREFHVFFTDRKISGANLSDSCRAVFASEEGGVKQNRIHSDRMQLEFTEGKLRHCTATGNVDSHVRQDRKGKREYMDNRTKGNSMEIFLDDQSEVEQIIVRDKVTGTHQFEQDRKKSQK
jgi:lipopolysaccharide export system protein LptA